MQIDFPLDIDIVDTMAAAATSLRQRLDSVDGPIVLFTGQTASSAYAERLIDLASWAPVRHSRLVQNSVANVYASEREIRSLSPRLIVAIGGGKVADFGKRLSYIANIPLLLIPTIIANDGLISPVAVLQDEGLSVSLPGRMPDTVLIDLDIVRSAPPRYLRAAACDLITNLSATNDWTRATDGDTGRMHHLALQMSRMAAHQILDCRAWCNTSSAFLRTIVYGQMLSGIAMALAGSSRPCSGSEHLIAHALDARKLGVDTLHGEMVGITSRFCLHLQQVDDGRLQSFFNSFSISRIFPGCEGMGAKDMAEIFALARKTRPGRSTVLDTFSDKALAERYLTYIAPDKEHHS